MEIHLLYTNFETLIIEHSLMILVQYIPISQDPLTICQFLFYLGLCVVCNLTLQPDSATAGLNKLTCYMKARHLPDYQYHIIKDLRRPR